MKETAERATRPSLPELFAELVEDGRDWISAEVAVHRAEARRRLIIAGIGLGLLTLSVTLVAGALVALLVGIVISLAPVVGPASATAIVTGATLVIASVVAWAGLTQLSRVTRKKTPDEAV